MKDSSIEDHNTKFKMLVSTSGLDKESPAVIDYYRETLNLPLQRRILSLEKPPKTLDEWFEWASRLDNNWRRMQQIMGRSRDTHTNGNNTSTRKKEEPRQQFNFTRRDPNAMNVDALSINKREEMMKKGLCFNCGKPGHLSRDCPDKKKTTASPPPLYSPPKKMAPKELYMHIRSITAMMSEDEREQFYQEAEKEGL